MSNSFALPTLTAMKTIDTSRFTEFQTRCSTNLFEHLKIDRAIIDMFDSEEIRDDFLSTFSAYMAYKCIVRRLDPHTRSMVNEILFMLPSTDMHLTLSNLENVFYCRRSTSVNTFIFICASFVEFNVHQNGIFTEMWNPIPVGFFESVGNPANDTFALRLGAEIRVERLANERQLIEANNMFENYRADLIEHHFAQNKCNRIQILPERFTITKQNADDSNQCLLCCTYLSNYVCHDCKYPMCKDCLKRLLKSTGECPGCRRKYESFSVQIVERSEEFNVLVDDLNEDVEEHPVTANSDGTAYTLEQINEEVYAEQHPPASANHDIELQHDSDSDIDPVIADDNDDDDDHGNVHVNQRDAEEELNRIGHVLASILPGVVFSRHVIDPHHTRRVVPTVQVVRNPTRRIDNVNRQLALNLIFGQDDEEHVDNNSHDDDDDPPVIPVRYASSVRRAYTPPHVEEEEDDSDVEEADDEYIPPQHEEEEDDSNNSEEEDDY